MKPPKVLDNKKHRVVDELKEELNKGSKLSVISAYFTIYAYAELKKELSKIENMRFIFTEPTFVHKDQELIREYYIERNPEKKMSGNEFEIKLRNEMKQAAYDELKAKPPAASFSISAPSLEVAAEQVAERINKQDVTLPAAALEKTDRTAVVKNDNEYKVDVLKINLDKAWELSAGVGSHCGDAYIPLGVQRNYDPYKAVAAEVHLVPEELARGKIKTSGWEVGHVWRF